MTRQKATARATARATDRTVHRPTPRWAAALVTTALLGGLAGGCATDQKIISQANNQNDQLEPTILTDPAIEDYMTKLGQRIVASAKQLDEQGVGPKAHTSGEDTQWMFQDVQFHMVGSQTLNAFTTGGHHVYIYSELFTSCKTEDEFAAVCSHEFAHIYCRHVQQGTNRQYGVYGAAALAAVGGAVLGSKVGDGGAGGALTGAAAGGAAGLGVGQFIGMGFTRKDEDQADQYGFKFYTHAGWDPKQFAGFFQTMIDKGYDTTPELASDHPKLSSRVEATEKRIKELPANADTWRRPDTVGQSQFEALQAKAARAAKALPQTKQGQAAELMLAAFPSCVAPTASPEQANAREAILKAAKRAK